MALIVADTDALVDFLGGVAPLAERVREALAADRLATTAVTAYELWLGALDPEIQSKVDLLLDAIDILPLDAEAAHTGARARRTLLDEGAELAPADSLVAGICLTHGAALLTGKSASFRAVEGLDVV